MATAHSHVLTPLTAVPAVAAPARTPWLERLTAELSLIVGLVASAALLGWALDIDAIKGAIPGLPPVRANTALCLLLTAGAIGLIGPLGPAEHGRRRTLALALVAMTATVALLSLAEYVLGRNLGIDELLFNDARSGVPNPGRIGTSSALAFLLLAAAVATLDRRSNLSRWLPSGFALGAATLAFVAVIGYISGLASLYDVSRITRMALPAAASFLLLALAIVCARADSEPLRLARSDTLGGRVVRRLSPAALALPIGLGALRLFGEGAGAFSADVGTWLFAVSIVVVLVPLTWALALSIDRAETAANSADASLHEAQRAERMFAQLLEFAPDAIVGSGSDGRIVLANHRAGELFGYPRSELIGQPVELLVPDWFGSPDADPRDGYIPDTNSTPAGTGVELVGVRKDASEFPAEISVSSIETENGIVATAAVRDVSDRADTERERALAEELNQARRLESVGQLAGGIAHDFNNLLGIIINYAKFAADALPEEGQTREDVEEIRTAAKRAAELTRQLLIFSRREVVKSEVLDLNDVVAGLGNLLHRALGERITLETRFGDELWPVEADPGQLEQVLVNLAVNARDAMPEGGRLIVETTNTVLDESFAADHVNVRPGRYVRLTVSDFGVGMDKEVRQRAFEPFFTTKSKGQGTGLGLATVYGIVTQAGGWIDVYSERGIGTSMKVHLPATDIARAADDPVEVEHPPGGRGETILVVEDQPEVRRVAERILSEAGYVVLTACGGADGIALAESNDIDLLLTDLIMPGMLGTELVDSVRDDRPDLNVVFMSGYSHALLAHETIPDSPGTAFIEKPFTADQLQHVIRDLLDGSRS